MLIFSPSHYYYRWKDTIKVFDVRDHVMYHDGVYPPAIRTWQNNKKSSTKNRITCIMMVPPICFASR